MEILDRLIEATLPGKIVDVIVGLFRTAVLVETSNGMSCGMAATLTDQQSPYSREANIRQAGCLHAMKSKDLVNLVHSDHLAEVSVGMAAINALLPPLDGRCHVLEGNAQDYIFSTCSDKKVAVVGHFRFVNHLPNYCKQSWCLELEPLEGDLPATAAPEILPQADFVAITATTLINHTVDTLLPHIKPGADCMLLGPSTPISPVLFESGITMISGTIVDDPARCFVGVSQGATLHQLYQEGWIRYANIKKDNFND